MTNTQENFAVWSEIPVADMDKAKAFYSSIFKVDFKDEEGPVPMATMLSGDGMGVSGHLYLGTSAPSGTGSTVHFAVPDTLEDAIARVEPAGGSVITPIITIPIGRFAKCMDPDGNSIGLFSFQK